MFNLLNSKHLPQLDLVLNDDMDYRPIYWILSSSQNFFTFREEIVVALHKPSSKQDTLEIKRPPSDS